jgi:drug/metabolite transporter (DMT)-like permease
MKVNDAKMRALHRIPPSVYWLVALLALLWGASWPFMKLGLEGMEPVRQRIFTVGVCTAGLFALAWATRSRLALPAGAWKRVLACSFFNMGAWSLLMIYGLERVEAGRAIILAYTFPVWAIPLSAWLMHERITTRRLWGLGLGMAGMALLLGDELFSLGRSPVGALLLVGSAITWAVGTVLMKRWPVDLPAVSFTAWQSLFAWPLLLAIGLVTESGPLHPFSLPVEPMIGVLYSAIVSGIFCQWAWYRIVQITPAGVSSLCTLAIPAVGVFLSMLILDERPAASDYAALLLVIGSLGVVLLPARAEPKKDPMDALTRH